MAVMMLSHGSARLTTPSWDAPQLDTNASSAKSAMRPRAICRDSLAERAAKAIPLSSVEGESNVVGA
jgi:hypothetical protein